MHISSVFRSFLAIGCFTAFASVHAAPLSNLYTTHNSVTAGGVAQPSAGATQIADHFSIPSGGVITYITFYGDGPATSFLVDFYGNSTATPAHPGTLLSTQTVALTGTTTTYKDSNNNTIDVYTDTTDSFTAAPGVEYWFSVVGVTTGASNFNWAEGGNGNSTTAEKTTNSGASWTEITNTEQAFDLQGHLTPEPSELLLTGTGLSGLAGLVRHRMRRTV